MIDAQARQALCATIRGIVFDVDGVLTDGRITYTDDGHELKSFHVQDGASMKLLQKGGIELGIITGRRSPAVARRARELDINFVVQGAGNKADALQGLIADGFPPAALAAVGDDLQDLMMFDHAAVDLSITVPNAHPGLLTRADWVTSRSGGQGICVELAEEILRSQNKWPY